MGCPVDTQNNNDSDENDGNGGKRKSTAGTSKDIYHIGKMVMVGPTTLKIGYMNEDRAREYFWWQFVLRRAWNGTDVTLTRALIIGK